ncbi:MAG: hypothetical protein ACQEV7_19870 [Bacillota bacterium]
MATRWEKLVISAMMSFSSSNSVEKARHKHDVEQSRGGSHPSPANLATAAEIYDQHL